MKNNKNNFKIPAKQLKSAVPLKDKRDKIFAWILAVLMIFWTVASVFGIIAFAHSCQQKGHVITASAYTDDVYYNGEFELVYIPAGTNFTLYEGFIDDTFFGPEFSLLGDLTRLFELELTGSTFPNSLFLPVSITSNTAYLENHDTMLVSASGESLVLSQDYYLPVFQNNVGSARCSAYLRNDYLGISFYASFTFGEVDFIDTVVDNARDEGYNEGYAEGVASAGEYTFMGLLSAVMDAPVQAFTGLFNLDILGVNLASFFYAIFTVCVILAVLRLIL